MHRGARPNGQVKSIIKSKEEDHSTGDVEEDSFADDDSSIGSASQTGSDGGNSSLPTVHPKRPNALQIAGRESKYVLCSKAMAYLVLLMSSIACGVFTYYFIQEEQEVDLAEDVRLVLLLEYFFVVLWPAVSPHFPHTLTLFSLSCCFYSSLSMRLTLPVPPRHRRVPSTILPSPFPWPQPPWLWTRALSFPL